MSTTLAGWLLAAVSLGTAVLLWRCKYVTWQQVPREDHQREEEAGR